MIDEDEEGEKIRKKWVDGEVLHLIIPRGEIDVEFAKNAKKKKKKKKKKKVNFVFIL